MQNKERIVRYTADELQAMIDRGESRSDWVKAAAVSDEDLEASIAADPDEAGTVIDWSSVSATPPEPKAVLHMRVDRDVLDYFRGQGRGYQTAINSVLSSYVEHKRKMLAK